MRRNSSARPNPAPITASSVVAAKNVVTGDMALLARRVLLSLLALGLPGLLGLALSACAPAARSPAPPHVAQCVSGYYEGKAMVPQWGEFGDLEFALNLYCDGPTYEGDVLAAGASSPIVGGGMRGGHVQVTFKAGGDESSLDGALDGTRIHGHVVFGRDEGSLELTRAGNPRPKPHVDLTPEMWREDLHFLARELPKRHMSAFHFTPRDRFDAAVAELDRDLPSLTGDGAWAGLDRIVNLVGDGHTYIRFPPDPPTFAFDIRHFGGESRVVAVGKGGDARALGARVVRINESPIERVRELLRPLTPVNETPSLREGRVDELLANGIALHGVGVLTDRNAATYALEGDAGKSFVVFAPAVAPGEHAAWTWAYEKPSLARQRADETFWFDFLPASNAIYCNFRRYDDLARHAAALMTAIDERKPQKLVIDLRMNGGGDYTEGLKQLIEPIRQRAFINAKGHLFVLIGPKTFSAAMSNASHFRAMTNATLVGQTIGEKPNSYQEPREVKLPRSGLIVRYSTRYYTFAEKGENLIRPDREIIPSWRDFRTGRDPELEWILGGAK